MTSAIPADAVSPVRAIPGDEAREPEVGLAICLSGGGYRAVVFHIGLLWRLNEVGLLSDVKRFSSVSGGSITAGVLAMNWKKLAFDGDKVATNFHDLVVAPVRRMARVRVDVPAVLTGALRPGTSISDQVAAAYRRHLFGNKTLQDLPDDPPRFIFNSTNLETGVLMRLSKPYLGDYKIGRILHPTLQLAIAVAAYRPSHRSFRPARCTSRARNGSRKTATTPTSTSRNTATKLGSLTAASATTSAWKPLGRTTNQYWSAMPAASSPSSQTPRATGHGRHTGCSRSSTARCDRCANARS